MTWFDLFDFLVILLCSIWKIKGLLQQGVLIQNAQLGVADEIQEPPLKEANAKIPQYPPL